MPQWTIRLFLKSIKSKVLSDRTHDVEYWRILGSGPIATSRTRRVNSARCRTVLQYLPSSPSLGSLVYALHVRLGLGLALKHRSDDIRLSRLQRRNQPSQVLPRTLECHRYEPQEQPVRTIHEAWAGFFGSRLEDGREDAIDKYGILALGVREISVLVLVCTLRDVHKEGCDRQLQADLLSAESRCDKMTRLLRRPGVHST
jgi:hypothetical protein